MKRFTVALAATGSLASAPASAQSFDWYIGVIFATGKNFCQRNTQPADGRTLSITQNTALFSVLGTTYGGNGQTTFALPNLNGRAPVGQGQGPGLAPIDLGEPGGTETVTVLNSQLPSHTHANARLTVNRMLADSAAPANKTLASKAPNVYVAPAGPNGARLTDNTFARPNVSTPAGGNQPMSVHNPYLTIKYCIVTQGIFPSRN